MSILQQREEQQLLTRLRSNTSNKKKITKKSTTIKNYRLLLCKVDHKSLYLPFKKIYFTEPIRCIELKQLIICHKQFRANFGMIPCLERCIISIKGKQVKSCELIGQLDSKMCIEIRIIK